MATAYGDSTSVDNTGATTVVLPKPSGLAAGDFMVAIIGQTNSNNKFTLAGWTEIAGSITTADSITILYKVASAGDAAASDFTFTSATNAVALGHLYRITGTGFAGAGNITATVVAETPATQNPTFSSSLVPPGVNSLLIMGMLYQEGGADIDGDNISGYEVVNSNPSWTEREALTNNGSDLCLESATATFVPVTTPGNFSMDIDIAPTTGESYGFLVSVAETANVTPTITVINMPASIQAPSVSGGASVTVSAPIGIASSMQAPTVATGEMDWKNTDKSAQGSVTNTDKS